MTQKKSKKKKLDLKGLNIETLVPDKLDPIQERIKLVHSMRGRKGWISR